MLHQDVPAPRLWRTDRLDGHRSLKRDDLAICHGELASDQHLGRAGGPQLEPIELPPAGIVLRNAAQRRHGGAARREAVDAEADTDR